MTHIIYIPGLGDKYDVLRRLGLRLWRRPGVRISHVPMRWLDRHETLEQKLTRIKAKIDQYPDGEVVLVGESAGGAASIVAMDRYQNDVTRVVTLCGMNHGAENVNPRLYRKNSAFKEAMQGADHVVSRLDAEAKAKIITLYSSSDFTVRPKNSLIAGVEALDLKITGHMIAILTVLFWRYRLITNMSHVPEGVR